MFQDQRSTGVLAVAFGARDLWSIYRRNLEVRRAISQTVSPVTKMDEDKPGSPAKLLMLHGVSPCMAHFGTVVLYCCFEKSPV